MNEAVYKVNLAAMINVLDRDNNLSISDRWFHLHILDVCGADGFVFTECANDSLSALEIVKDKEDKLEKLKRMLDALEM